MNPDYAYVYILTNFSKTVLYTGVTTDLKQRMTDHKNGVGSAFTRKYKTHILLWYKGFDRIEDAIKKEKQIKKWLKSWKHKMISEFNPEWKDMYWEIMGL